MPGGDTCGFAGAILLPPQKQPPRKRFKSLYLGTVDLPLPLSGGVLDVSFRGVRVKVIDAKQYRLDYKSQYTTQFLATLPAATARDGDAGVDIIFNTLNYLEFLTATCGRLNVIDGDSLFSLYNFDGLENAFFNGTYMCYGNGGPSMTPLVSADVVAHELTHGLIQTVCSLVYQGESGALNESFADCFGVAFEYWLYAKYNDDIDPLNNIAGAADWLLGEDITLRQRAMRSLADPPSLGQPMEYSGAMWMDPMSLEDNGGVHCNSGVGNHLFYLVSNQIGLMKATELWYRALRRLKTDSTYVDFADMLSRVCSVEDAVTIVSSIAAVKIQKPSGSCSNCVAN